MLVKIVKGDLFESEMQTLINAVNCVGVMGKGIALEFKKRFPEMYKDYVKKCKNGQVKLGEPYLYKSIYEPWIMNFPTKEHWWSVSQVKDIESGLDYLVKHYKEWGIASLAVPSLGCGEGHLEWRIVGPMLYRYLNKLDIPVELYTPL
jgi:O-acetyl-ADP-ribose deacetylase (regulator of RNase III)